MGPLLLPNIFSIFLNLLAAATIQNINLPADAVLRLDFLEKNNNPADKNA